MKQVRDTYWDKIETVDAIKDRELQNVLSGGEFWREWQDAYTGEERYVIIWRKDEKWYWKATEHGKILIDIEDVKDAINWTVQWHNG